MALFYPQQGCGDGFSQLFSEELDLRLQFGIDVGEISLVASLGAAELQYCIICQSSRTVEGWSVQ